jgi:cell division protein DivIC
MSSGTVATTSASTGARRRLKLLLFVMVLFLGWAGYTVAKQHEQLDSRRAEMRDAEQNLYNAQQKNEALKQEIARLNDPEYIGQLARKEHGMGLPGERPIQIDKNGP